MLSLAPCAVVLPWEAMVIGAIGRMLTIGCVYAFNKMKVDDPVGAISVHSVGGLWVRNNLLICME